MWYITMVFLLFIYPLGIQYLVHGEYYLGEITMRNKPLAIYVVFWTVSFVAVRNIQNSMVLYNVFYNSSMYFILSNVYFINIITNIIGRSLMSDNLISMILNTLYIGLFRSRINWNSYINFHLPDMVQLFGLKDTTLNGSYATLQYNLFRF